MNKGIKDRVIIKMINFKEEDVSVQESISEVIFFRVIIKVFEIV